MNVRFVIGPTITPVVQNVTRIAAGVHLDFTKRYSRKLAMEAPPTAATASMMEMGIAVPRKAGLKSLANQPRSVWPIEVPGTRIRIALRTRQAGVSPPGARRTAR